MNILVTGTNGYVGSALSTKLKGNITCLTRKEVDLTNSSQVNDFFKDKYYDVVIHCAMVGGSRLKPDTTQVLDQNLTMYYNLLNNQSHFNHLISFGSGAEVYSVDTPYGLSKRVIFESIKDKPNYTNIRIFAVFDENELNTRFIKSNIKRYINKESIKIHQNKIMDFIYMDDLVSLINYSISHPELKLIECSYPQQYSLLDIANLINTLSDYKVPIIMDSKELTLPYAGVYNDLGINFIGLEEGIKKVYQHLKNE
jgi:nucleoside-diphosphate-sugar epimerase